MPEPMRPGRSDRSELPRVRNRDPAALGCPSSLRPVRTSHCQAAPVRQTSRWSPNRAAAEGRPLRKASWSSSRRWTRNSRATAPSAGDARPPAGPRAAGRPAGRRYVAGQLGTVGPHEAGRPPKLADRSAGRRSANLLPLPRPVPQLPPGPNAAIAIVVAHHPTPWTCRQPGRPRPAGPMARPEPTSSPPAAPTRSGDAAAGGQRRARHRVISARPRRSLANRTRPTERRGIQAGPWEPRPGRRSGSGSRRAERLGRQSHGVRSRGSQRHQVHCHGVQRHGVQRHGPRRRVSSRPPDRSCADRGARNWMSTLVPDRPHRGICTSHSPRRRRTRCRQIRPRRALCARTCAIPAAAASRWAADRSGDSH
jgi:hypothetical protein